MNRRQFVVPALSALGLSVTAACADPIIGTWDATSVSSNGHTVTLPYTYIYTDTGSGASYTYTQSIQLTVGKDLTGTFTQTYTTQTDTAAPNTKTYQYGLTATKTDKAAYDISIPGDSMDLACTLAKKVLTCDNNSNNVPLTYVFAKQ